MAAILVKGLEKSFGAEKILSGFSLSVERGEIVGVLGPNGCGKSSLLNILAGTLKEDSGQIKMLKKEELSYVFQNYRESLLPWKTNFENLAFPLKIRGFEKKDIAERVLEIGKRFGIASSLEKHPYEMSGGQQQIIAFARSLVTDPKVLFIDEPFSALDYENSLKMRKMVLEYHSKNVPTILFVTHSLEEAVHLANKVVVLSRKPAKIIETVENKATYPREIGYLKSRSFYKTKARVLDAFQSGINQ